MVQDEQLAAFDALAIPDFVSRAYPYADILDLQVVLDWTAWGFIADDAADSVTDLEGLRRFYSVCVAVLRGEAVASTPAERALADLRDRIAGRSSVRCLDRFADTVEEWFAAMYLESSNRVQGVALGRQEYRELREISVGMYTEYALFEVTHRCHFPDSLWDQPQLRSLMTHTANIIGYSNDIFSVVKEQRIGDPHNLVLCIAHETGCSLAQAAVETAKIHNLEMQRFLMLESDYLRSDSPASGAASGAASEATLFVDLLRAWIRGNVDWAMTSHRYGMQQQTLDVALEPSASMVAWVAVDDADTP